MKLTSWAICSLALAAGVFGAGRPKLLKSLPRCTISCLEKYNNSDFDAVDICNNEDVKQELDNCFADKCGDFERFDIAKIYANACDNKQKDNRNNHYVLLVAEIPAWISPWLRLYSSWITYESLSLDDYVMVVCGLLYTVFATLVHFAHSVASDTILWNAVPEYITDGLKLVFMADIFELACSCLLRVAILLVCLRSPLSGRYMVATAATLVLTILSSIALALLRVFRCSPIAFAWEGWEPSGRDEETGGCLAQDSLAYAASSIDIFLNLVLLVMLSHLIFSRFAILDRPSASEGCRRDQPPAADNRRDQHAGNTVNRYEDAEAEFISERVVRNLVKETAEETSRIELTSGRQNLWKRQNRNSRRSEVFYDLPIDRHDWYTGPNEDD
ncbi:hypothetical protein FMUND_4864 [Fusarium mundagurra]|uniref:Rhodopsin domain-containing protein n=1 Tax=Fusarium mundagurra TaxID=1567541 RepID=A0A8H5YUB2_9HYPO|nr:hypothetical protein FMUND_4864 [Fusarium mundagurra]